jgi:hypothetical protein
MFVRVGRERVAGVVTIPDDEPRALVALLQGGGGATRSYHNSTWTIASRDLARRGLATLRMDWVGIGDSTGSFSQTLATPPAEVLRAFLEVAVRATDLHRLGLAAECGGAATALALADDLAARVDSVAVIKLLAEEGRVLNRLRDSVVSRRRLIGFVDRHPTLNTALRRSYWKLQMRTSRPVMQQLASFRKRAPVLLMGFGAADRYESATAALQRKHGVGDFEMAEIPFRGANGMPDWVGRERFIREQLVEWFDRTLLDADPLGAEGAEPPADGAGRGPRFDAGS